MTLKESQLWFAGWRPVSENYPRRYWIDPESGASYELNTAHKIAVDRQRALEAIRTQDPQS